MEKWELWEPVRSPNEEPPNDYFIPAGPAGEQLRQSALEDGYLCTLTVEAESYDAAMQKFYDFKGWGKYRPRNTEKPSSG
jgi:hypothetical protein